MSCKILLAAALVALPLRGILLSTAAGAKQTRSANNRAINIPAKYMPIVERNMFGFMARPAQGAKPQPSDATTAPVFVDTPGVTLLRPHGDIPVPEDMDKIGSASATSKPNFTLTGIIRIDGEYKAFVEDKTTGSGYYLGQGDSAGDYTAIEITAAGVVLIAPGDRRIELKIENSPRAQTGASDAPDINSNLVPTLPPKNSNGLPMHVLPRMGK